MTIGFSFLSKAFQTEDKIPWARMGELGPNCTFQLYSISLVFLLGLGHTGFQARKSLGWFLIISYVIFIVTCTMGAFKVIHPMGTDHHDEEKDYE